MARQIYLLCLDIADVIRNPLSRHNRSVFYRLWYGYGAVNRQRAPTPAYICRHISPVADVIRVITSEPASISQTEAVKPDSHRL